MDHIIKAIAAFERTLISGRSPFDRYVFGDEPTALSDSAKRGMALFFRAHRLRAMPLRAEFFRTFDLRRARHRRRFVCQHRSL
jgi:cytochrome c peroxidase